MAAFVRPVLRVPGSKYKKLALIFDTLKLSPSDSFGDMFGGSLIVGVNAFSTIGCKTTINDFDNIYPLDPNYVLKNMLSFQGLGKHSTPSAQRYFLTRVRNEYWEKFDAYNNILDKLNVLHLPFEEFPCSSFTALYVDPPYDDVKRLYKKDFTKAQHIKLFEKLNALNDVKILVSYNDTPFIRDLYKDWSISTVPYSYRTGKTPKTGVKQKLQELWITKNV